MRGSRVLGVPLVGWLWADLLLGMFAIFLAAANPPLVEQRSEQRGVEPRAVEVEVDVDVPALLGDEPAARQREQEKVLAAARSALEGRRAAVILAFGAHPSAADGDRIAREATLLLRDGLFGGSAIKTYHELAPAERAGRVALEIFRFY
jgi:hypothetical protein